MISAKAIKKIEWFESVFFFQKIRGREMNDTCWKKTQQYFLKNVGRNRPERDLQNSYVVFLLLELLYQLAGSTVFLYDGPQIACK